jgi:hypothetical protein
MTSSFRKKKLDHGQFFFSADFEVRSDFISQEVIVISIRADQNEEIETASPGKDRWVGGGQWSKCSEETGKRSSDVHLTKPGPQNGRIYVFRTSRANSAIGLRISNSGNVL